MLYQFSNPLSNPNQETQSKRMKVKDWIHLKCVDVHYLQIFFIRWSIHDGRMNDSLIILNLQTKCSAILIEDSKCFSSRLILSRVIFKFQHSRFNNQDSRKIKIKIPESREDSIKISTKKFFKTLSSTKKISQNLEKSMKCSTLLCR